MISREVYKVTSEYSWSRNKKIPFIPENNVVHISSRFGHQLLWNNPLGNVHSDPCESFYALKETQNSSFWIALLIGVKNMPTTYPCREIFLHQKQMSVFAVSVSTILILMQIIPMSIVFFFYSCVNQNYICLYDISFDSTNVFLLSVKLTCDYLFNSSNEKCKS